MAFVDNWRPRIDGVDNADSSAVNEIAAAVISNESKISKSNQIFSNALKGTATGEAVGMHDVSPLPHEMAVKVSGVEDISAVKVLKFGKNILKADNGRTHNGVTFDLQADGSYHVYGTNNGSTFSYVNMYAEDLPRGKYTGSGCPVGGSNTTYFLEFYNQATRKSVYDYGGGVAFDKESGQRIIVQLCVKPGQTVDLIFKPMIEVGDGDKVFAPYAEPTEYTPNADGTVDGVTALHPTTTLMTDTEGAVLDVGYNRDINKAFAAFEVAVNALVGA